MELSRSELIDVLVNKYDSWENIIKENDNIEKNYGWEFTNDDRYANDPEGTLYSIYSTDIGISKKDLFAVTPKDTPKDSLDGFSYWDNAWWRTC